MDVVRLLGRLILPFTGHSDNEESENKGVFREIIDFFTENNPIVDDTSQSETLYQTLCDVLQSNEIDASKIRAQCYDGASNVSGIRTGPQPRVT
jgi:hypothetical protein